MNLNFDLNTLFSLAQLLVILFTGVKFLGDMNKSIAILTAQREAEAKVNAEKFDRIEQQLKQLNETTVQIAAQEVRLNTFDQRLGELIERINNVREERQKLLPPPPRRRKN